MRKKTKRNVKAVGGLVVGATAASLIGSKMPGTTGGALTSAGTGMASFVGPAVNVLGASMVFSELKKLKPGKYKPVYKRNYRMKGGRK